MEQEKSKARPRENGMDAPLRVPRAREKLNGKQRREVRQKVQRGEKVYL